MKQLIFHIGLPKTGTTSIQSTLFWNPPQSPFRFISLDSTFGNQLVLAAFSSRFGIQGDYFSGVMSKRQKRTMKEFSLNYLRKCLEDCASQNLTPIVSAETACGFPVQDLMKIREFAEQFGFTVRVIGYFRPMLDLVESAYQQFVKIGHTNHLQHSLHAASNALAVLPQLDTAFGRENVDCYIFDRNRFPDRCVVKHFLKTIGLDSQNLAIVRENESTNLNALRFLYAWNIGKESHKFSFRTRFRRRLLMEAMKNLQGPLLRFGETIAEQVEKLSVAQAAAFLQRLGEPIPMTSSTRQGENVLNAESEMLDFSPESIDWLARTSWSRNPTSNRNTRSTKGTINESTINEGNVTNDNIAWVNKSLNRLCLQPRLLAIPLVILDELKLRRHRQKLLKQWISQTAQIR